MANAVLHLMFVAGVSFALGYFLVSLWYRVDELCESVAELWRVCRGNDG